MNKRLRFMADLIEPLMVPSGSTVTLSRDHDPGYTGQVSRQQAADGEVDYDYQRREVERMIRQVRGVVGVTDAITVKPPVSPEKVQAVIEDAFGREAEIDARHTSVEVSDHTAKLYGHVHSIHEASAARAAAASAPRGSHGGEPSRGLSLGVPPPRGVAGPLPLHRPPQRHWPPPGPRTADESHRGPVRMISDFDPERAGGGSRTEASSDSRRSPQA